MSDNDSDSMMQRFESLLGRLFAAGKKDLEKAEEIVEEAIEPTERLEPDE
jgi:hypothetical protein